MIRSIFFIFAFLILVNVAEARDERSIKYLRNALVALAPDVDPGEAELLSVTAHTTARSLAREYRIVLNPEFQCFLVNIGVRKRGWWPLDTRYRRASERTQVQDAGASLGCCLCGNIEREQLLGSHCTQPAFSGRNHHRRLAQGRPIILVHRQKRLRVRIGTALRSFRDHGMEGGRPRNRLAARLRTEPAETENNGRGALTLLAISYARGPTVEQFANPVMVRSP